MKRVVVLLIVGVVLFGVCAQRADAQNANIAQRIVGTWDHRLGTFVFNANGTVKIGDESFGYSIANTQLALFEDDEIFVRFNVSFSPDGKTLILEVTRDEYETFGGRGSLLRLIKK